MEEGFAHPLRYKAVHSDRWVRLRSYALLHGIYAKLLVFPTSLRPSEQLVCGLMMLQRALAGVTL